MENEKVTYKSLESARVRIDNSVDTERVYNIEANVNVGGAGNVQGMDSGLVVRKSDGMQVAYFTAPNSSDLSVNYMQVEPTEYCDIVTAISAFIADCKTMVTSGVPLSL